MNRVVSFAVGVLGLILSAPFFYVIMFGEHQPYMSIARICALFMCVVGLPMAFAGAFGFLLAGSSSIKSTTTASTTDIDIGRVRHAVEMDRMNRR